MCFSTIQYNTTVKPFLLSLRLTKGFSTIQYNTTVKPTLYQHSRGEGFSTIQYNTTVKPHVRGFTEVNVVVLTWYYCELVLKS